MSAEIRSRIVAFLREIGLSVQARRLPGPTFLPGIRVEHGGLVFDPDRLRYPGDLLHEAGHLAVVPAIDREVMDGEIVANAAHEMAAIAWSWAAAVHLRLDPRVVFHPHGYKGGAEALIENFTHGRYVGVPMLEWRGMTDYQRAGAEQSATRYPVMKQWLCD